MINYQYKTKDQMEKIAYSQVKKGHYVILKQKPCKITEFVHSKTGKHGSMKVHLTGTDCFTDKNVVDCAPGHGTLSTFKLIKNEYQVMSILHDDENQITIDFLNQKNMSTNNVSLILDFKKTPIMIPRMEEIKEKLETSEETIIATVITVPVPISDKANNDDFLFENIIESYCIQKILNDFL